nr:signal peptide peptidase SppA [Deltaproteobacteria bacterium]
PGTLTGSIGVIIQLANLEGLMQKLGLEGYNVKSGPYKDIGSPLRPLSPEGKAILQSVVDSVHSQFVRAVATGRSMEESKVRELADGRIYSGEQAKDLGLVDNLGNMDDTIDMISKRAGIKGAPQVIYSRIRDERWWESLLFSLFSEQVKVGRSWGLRYQ